MSCLSGNSCPPYRETAFPKPSASAGSCGSCGCVTQWERWLHTGPSWSSWLGWQPGPCSATTAAIAQLVAQVLPQSLAAAQELMMEQVADVRIAEAQLEMRGAHLNQLVKTSLCRPAGMMGFARCVPALRKSPKQLSISEGCCSCIWLCHPSQDVQNYFEITSVTIAVATGLQQDESSLNPKGV